MKNLFIVSIFSLFSMGIGNAQNTAVKIAPNATSPGNSVLIGTGAGTTSTGDANVLMGYNAGNSLAGGNYNMYLGSQAGQLSTTANQNVFIGHATGYNTTTGVYNTFIGRTAGFDNTTGTGNLCLGVFAGGVVSIGNYSAPGGVANTTGNYNTLIGFKASPALSNLTNATAIGANAVVGASNAIVLGDASVNVGIGVTIPRRKLEVNGEAIIGGGITSLPAGYNLYVANGVLTEKVTIAAKNTVAWADFVFEKNYKLRPLTEVESYIQQNGHLPEVPSTQEVQTNGMNLAENDAKLLQKIEELTLYMIAQDKKIKNLEKQIVKRKH
jgi:trimeric autotransporter adhesin